ncbi:hypothetical protein [Bacillus salipaludis]|nr:hypothetical protein [Bacillus salipaludis]
MIGRKDAYQSKLEFIDLNVFVPSNPVSLSTIFHNMMVEVSDL